MGTLSCGDSISGDYNNEKMTIYVQTLHRCNLIFDASLSDFDVAYIEGYTHLGSTPIDTDNDKDGILTLYNTPIADYKFFMAANQGIIGTFHINIHCQTKNPTSAPSREPTKNPSLSPTLSTLNPSISPTTQSPTNPTLSPNFDPTMHTTLT